MPRADYDHFVAEAPAFLGEEYVVSTPETNPHQAALFGKVWLRGTRFVTEETIEAGFDQGIFVDLLPYDALSSDPGDGGKAASRLPLLAKRVVSFPCEEHRRCPTRERSAQSSVRLAGQPISRHVASIPPKRSYRASTKLPPVEMTLRLHLTTSLSWRMQPTSPTRAR